MSHNVICDGCQEEKHEDYVEWRVCERCISQCNGQAADEIERLRAERDQAKVLYRERVASTKKQAQRIAELERTSEELIESLDEAKYDEPELRSKLDKQRQRIAELEDAAKKAHDELMNLQPHIVNCCFVGKQPFIDDHVDAAMAALAKEQDDDT